MRGGRELVSDEGGGEGMREGREILREGRGREEHWVGGLISGREEVGEKGREDERREGVC